MLLLSFGDGEMRGRISVIACGRFRGRGIDNDRHVAVFHASYWNTDSRIGIFARGVRCSI